MNREEYKNALEAAHREIQHCLEERARIDERLAQLKSTSEALSKLLNIENAHLIKQLAELSIQVPADPGITKAIRELLANSKIPLAATEIKAGVETLGVDLSQYVNASAVVHNTLTRLEKQGELVRVVNAAGQTVAYAPKRFTQIIAEYREVPDPLAKTTGRTLRDKK